VVIRGGENISCTHVEAAIYDYPPVAEAVVFGVPDPRFGEELAAIVVRRPGQTFDRDSLVGHLQTKLGKYEVPRHILIRNEPLPRIASGKMDRRSLRKEAVQLFGVAQS
jgi:long-chain acyl-CoA synthetase